MKLPKSELETLCAAKPGAEQEPGYFNDKGTFVRGPFWKAKLGKQTVSVADDTCNERGFYMTKAHAIDGAKLFQEKAQKLLDDGEYLDGAEPSDAMLKARKGE